MNWASRYFAPRYFAPRYFGTRRPAAGGMVVPAGLFLPGPRRARTFTVAASGGLNWGGTAPTARTWYPPVQGGLEWGGTAALVRTGSWTAQDGSNWGGAARVQWQPDRWARARLEEELWLLTA